MGNGFETAPKAAGYTRFTNLTPRRNKGVAALRRDGCLPEGERIQMELGARGAGGLASARKGARHCDRTNLRRHETRTAIDANRPCRLAPASLHSHAKLPNRCDVRLGIMRAKRDENA